MGDIYSTVTSRIVERIETALRWEKPWTSAFQSDKGGSLARPINAVTGNAYRGVNVPILWSAQRSSPIWATYKQWSSIGAQVQRGEHGTMGVFWKRVEIASDDDNSDDEPDTRLIARAFILFNAEQVEGYTATPVAPKPDGFDPLAAAETFITNTRAVITYGGDRAYYSPALDYIRLPHRSQFVATKTRTAAESYYGTALHELGHWTGHKTRCAREFGSRFGNETYAFEELIAELSAAFACADLGISSEPRDDHAAYVASWLKTLRNDRKAIFTAASRAEQAVRFLHSLQPSQENAIAA